MAVEIDSSAFEAGLDALFGEGKMLRVQEAFTEMVAKDCNDNVPIDTGNLYETIEWDTRGVGDGEVVWPAPYAIYPYTSDHLVSPSKNGDPHPDWVEYTKGEKGGEWAGKLTGMIA